MENKKFLELMTVIGEIVGKMLSDAALDIYYDVLGEFPDKDMERATATLLKTWKWPTFPKPSDFLQLLEGSPDDKALMAWSSVMDAIKLHGYTSTMDFADKKIHMCITQLGGWQKLCTQSVYDLKFTEKEFEKLYVLFGNHPRECPATLIGFIGQTNSGTGYKDEIPEAIKIGYPKRKELSDGIQSEETDRHQIG